MAAETLQIIRDGAYTLGKRRVDISQDVARCNEHTVFMSSEESGRLAELLGENPGTGAVELRNETTLSAVLRLANRESTGVGVLNFASARNPGGGFLNGALAQEESLAVASSLYESQLRCSRYYEANRAFRSMVYTDSAIWSPDVVFFRNDTGALLESPVVASVLTLPAVNFGQVLAKGEDAESAKRAMKRRMKIALATFADHACEVVVLGAYGCGVFRNDPVDVATWWDELLAQYGGCFRRVVFAVLDRTPGRKTMAAFEMVRVTQH